MSGARIRSSVALLAREKTALSQELGDAWLGMRDPTVPGHAGGESRIGERLRGDSSQPGSYWDTIGAHLNRECL
jgi:hypothetical protein